ncbi:hypothetical protein [Microbacterium sp.]|uniref:hypothetical protein n=1 Tax=Microbacterium sp. TaxID=51671 RepID=UPI003F6FC50E
MTYATVEASGREFVTRRLAVTGPTDLLIERVTVTFSIDDIEEAAEVRTFAEAPFAVTVRTTTDSLLSGVQNPHTHTELGDTVTVSYEPAMRVSARFESSPQFFAVSHRSGSTIQPVPPKTRVGVGESRPRARFRNPSEALPMDLEEITTLRAVVRHFLSPLPLRHRSILYTYWLPLPHAPATDAEEALWIETIDNFVDLGGDLLLTVPLVDASVPTNAPDATWELEPAGSRAAKIMDHARASGLEVGYYMGVAAGNLPYSNAPGLGLPSDAPDSWRKVRRDGTLAKENCLAHEEYARWLETVSINTIETYGLSAWSWDPGPGDGIHCYSESHGHLPGKGVHAGWLNGQKMIAALHERFAGLHLQGYYGQKQDGTWGLKGISQHEGYWEQQAEWGSALYPELSAERLNANGSRQQAWWSQNFRYLPAELNHPVMGRMSQICVEDTVLGQTFDWWGWRFGLLSAIAIGGAPTLPTLPPRDVPSAIREEYRWWLEWAKAHSETPAYDIAGGAQVELGAVDWYLRGGPDEAHLFLCNPGPRPARVRVDLHDHLPETLSARGTVVDVQSPSRRWSSDAVPVRFDADVPAFSVLVYAVTTDPESVDTRAPLESTEARSAAVALDLWRDEMNRRVPIPNREAAPSRTIHCALPALSRALDASRHEALLLRERLPLIPDTFAYVDPERAILVIPLLDADDSPDLQVLVDGIPVDTEVYRFVHEQMSRYSLVEADVDQWPESTVVWWCDLTEHLASVGPRTLSIVLPVLGLHQFLGPYLQVPEDVAADLESLGDSAIRFTDGPLHVVPPLRRAGADGPRVREGWVTPDSVASQSEFTLHVRAENADEVFATIHVASGSLTDRRLRRVEGAGDLWVLDAHVYSRTAVILDRPDAIVWAVRDGAVSDDFRVRIPWELDPLES